MRFTVDTSSIKLSNILTFITLSFFISFSAYLLVIIRQLNNQLSIQELNYAMLSSQLGSV